MAIKTTKWNDLKHKNTPEQRAAIRREAVAELERIGFGKLRQARKLTQLQMAERLSVPQSSISRLEGQSDHLLSTLRGYIEGLGGELELRVAFPEGGQFVLESFKSIETRRPARGLSIAASATPRRKRV
jgi:DNA-binding XRE family transcriptional regulator